MISPTQHDALPEAQTRYLALDKQLQNSSFNSSAAEAHGIASGLLCRKLGEQQLNAAMEAMQFNDADSVDALHGLLAMSEQHLSQTSFAFDLYLPDEESLPQRVAALSQWCHGYIIGLMHDGDAFRKQLNQDANDSIDDIIQFSNIDAFVMTDDDADNTANEVAFIEIREYTRVAVQLIFETDRPVDNLNIANNNADLS